MNSNFEDNLNKIHTLYEDFNLVEVPLFQEEIRGIQKLTELGQLLMAPSIQ
ncbi:MAG: ArsA-related P-loop ATPase [Promethearchaeota archaeon]